MRRETSVHVAGGGFCPSFDDLDWVRSVRQGHHTSHNLFDPIIFYGGGAGAAAPFAALAWLEKRGALT